MADNSFSSNWQDPNFWGEGANYGGNQPPWDAGTVVGGQTTGNGSGYNGADGLDSGYYGPTTAPPTGDGSGYNNADQLDSGYYGPTTGVPGGQGGQDPTGSFSNPNGSGFGNFDPSQITNALGGQDPATGLGMLYGPAFLAQAFKQWSDSGQYMDTANQAAQRADTFGPANREYYADQMNALSADPSAIAETPGYKFSLEQGLGSLDRKSAAGGYLGAGKASKDEMDYASGLASQTYNTEMNRLMQLSGSQFNPSSAAQMLMTGKQQQLGAQNSAMASAGNFLASLMGPKNQATDSSINKTPPVTINNNVQGGAGGGGGGTAGGAAGNPGAAAGAVLPGLRNVGGSGLNLPGQIGAVSTGVAPRTGMSPPPQMNTSGGSGGLDVNDPEVQQALRDAGIDPNDPMVQQELGQLDNGSGLTDAFSSPDPLGGINFDDPNFWDQFNLGDGFGGSIDPSTYGTFQP